MNYYRNDAILCTQLDNKVYTKDHTMAYIRCQNYILLLIILLCDIHITFCNMHALFGYIMSHYAMFILYYAT